MIFLVSPSDSHNSSSLKPSEYQLLVDSTVFLWDSPKTSWHTPSWVYVLLYFLISLWEELTNYGSPSFLDDTGTSTQNPNAYIYCHGFFMNTVLCITGHKFSGSCKCIITAGIFASFCNCYLLQRFLLHLKPYCLSCLVPFPMPLFNSLIVSENEKMCDVLANSRMNRD